MIQAASWAFAGAIGLGALALVYDYVESVLEPNNGPPGVALAGIGAAIGLIAGAIFGAVFRDPPH